MIDIKKIRYKVIMLQPDGTQLDITNVTENLGWEEGDRELAARISFHLANAIYNGTYISQLIKPGIPIFVLSDYGLGFDEVIRGIVTDWNPVFVNSRTSVDITAYDELFFLQKNQDNRYFSDGTGTKTAITTILNDWGVPIGEYQGPDIAHTKIPFKNEYLSDMILKLLDDAEKKQAGKFIVRAVKGKVCILPRGSNEEIYHFNEGTNTMLSNDRHSSANLVTRVKVVGKEDKDGHQKVEAVVDGKTEFGIRQIIYTRGAEDKSLDDAKKAAQKILDEKGKLDRRITIEAPDLPFLRKGDKINVKAGTLDGYFYVKSVRHNAKSIRMTMEIEEAKE